MLFRSLPHEARRAVGPGGQREAPLVQHRVDRIAARDHKERVAVRGLAQRSAAAAKETAVKIADSVGKSQQGVRISAEVAQSFKAIRDEVLRLDGISGEIATASVEQNEGIAQLNGSVVDMDRVTQENAARAEESSSTAEELKAQAAQLSSTVGLLLTLLGGKRRNDLVGQPGEIRPGGRRRRDRVARPTAPQGAAV